MSQKDGRIRQNMQVGSKVQILLKEDQASGFLTNGNIEEILSESAKDNKGIKVRLTSGKVGRVIKILSKKASSKPSNKKSKVAEHRENFPGLEFLNSI